VSRAAAADHKPFEFEVHVDGELAGIYKGNSAENLEQSIKYFMGEAGLAGEVRVTPTSAAETAPESADSGNGEPQSADASSSPA